MSDWPMNGDLTDDEKLRVAYGDVLGAVRSVRERIGSLIYAKRLVDKWRGTTEARDLGVAPVPWQAPDYAHERTVGRAR